MANGTRTLTLVIVLIVGIAVGWFIGRGQAPPPTPPQPTPVPTAPLPTPVPTLVAGNHLIEVGPAASQVSEEWAAISKKKDNKIFWIPKDEAQTLQIVFKASDFPPEAKGEPPFKGGRNGQNQVIKCKDGVCKSGHISDNLPQNYDKLTYKSTQILISPNGRKDEADAGIIIQP